MTRAVPAMFPGAVRELRCWNESALAGLGRRLDGAWRGWCAGWGFESAPVRCENAREAGSLYAGPRHWFEVGMFSNDGLWIGMPGHEPSSWIRQAAFGDNVASAGWTVAEHVARDAWQDLCRELASAFDADVVADSSACATALPAGHRLPWSGAVVAQLTTAGATLQPLVVHLGPAVATGHCPADAARPQVARSALTPVSEALGHRGVTLDVHLARAEVELGMLQSLRLGDVVVLSHALDRPASVRWSACAQADEAPPLFDAHLGRRGARKAVELVALRVPPSRSH